MSERDFSAVAFEEFGISEPPRPLSEILRPVELSTTTRRLTAAEQRQRRGDLASIRGEVEREAELRAELERHKLDALEDDAWNREMDRTHRAAAWEEKVATQQDAMRMLESMRTLQPGSPDYAERMAELQDRFPRGMQDPRVKSLADSREKIFQTAEARREEANRRATTLADRMDAEQRRLETARQDRAIARQEAAALDLASAGIDPALATVRNPDGSEGLDPVRAAALVGERKRAAVTDAEARQARALIGQNIRARERLREREREMFDPEQKKSILADIADLEEETLSYRELLRAYDRARGRTESPAKGVPADTGTETAESWFARQAGKKPETRREAAPKWSDEEIRKWLDEDPNDPSAPLVREKFEKPPRVINVRDFIRSAVGEDEQ